MKPSCTNCIYNKERHVEYCGGSDFREYHNFCINPICRADGKYSKFYPKNQDDDTNNAQPVIEADEDGE